MNKGINLLVDKRSVKFSTPISNRLNLLRFGAIGILFIVGASSVIFSMLIVLSALPQLQMEEQKAKADLAVFGLAMNKFAFVKERGESIRKIIKQRPYYDKKIEIVENKLQADVSLEALSMSKNKYTFKFYSKNIESLDKVINKLSDVTGNGKDFSQIYLTSLTVNQENKNFVLVVDML